jgi:hypothetical protein
MRTPKVFSSLSVGHFLIGPIARKINQALNTPKIDMLQRSLLLLLV